METDELLELTVDEQKDELQNLDLDQLKELRKAENRNTAIDNIDRELNQKGPQEDDVPNTEQTAKGSIVKPSSNKAEKKPELTDKQEIRELEKKVDYIISRCKTTSQEGFEEYDK